MGVVYVEELYSGRRGRDGIERKREYVRVFEVRTESAIDDPTDAGGTILLPRNGDQYKDKNGIVKDAGAFMIRIDPVQHEADPTLWTVTCNYSTVLPFSQARESASFNPTTGTAALTPSGLNPTAREENPIDRPTVWRGDDEMTTVAVTHDKDGNPILNAALRPFDPPFKDESPTTVLVATKNYSIGTWTLETIDNFKNAVNNAVWFGLPERTARVVRAPWQFLNENGIAFQQINWHIKIRNISWNGGEGDVGQGWDVRLLNAGYEELVEGVYYAITDLETGVAPERPSLLAADGQALLAGNSPTYRTFRVRKEKAFSLLNL